MKVYAVKDWPKFQHFKDRKPPWIKLYRTLLDDIEWHNLKGADAKMLINLWMVASESNGIILPLSEMAFRLRITEKEIENSILNLTHWLIYDDIKVISARYQDDTPEREKEREKETEEFATFWDGYPRKINKKKAMVAFLNLTKAKRNLATKDSLTRYVGCETRFIPYPTTYLHGERWEDEGNEPLEEKKWT